jgi:hypothetical protein
VIEQGEIMKTITGTIVVIAAMSTMFAFGIPNTSQADPAVVVWGGNFWVYDGDGNVVNIEDFNGHSLIVVTDSTDGVINVQINAKALNNHTGQAVQYDSENNPSGPGEVCSFHYGGDIYFTEEWRETISASGNMTAYCLYRD